MDARIRSAGTTWIKGLAVVVGLMGLCSAIWLMTRGPKLPAGMTREEYDRAAATFERLYRTPATQGGTLLILARQAFAENRLQTALECCLASLDAAPRDAGYRSAARLLAGEIALQLNRAREAEEAFYACLEDAVPGALAEQAAARSWLGYLYSVQLRFEERAPILQESYLAGTAHINELKQLHFPYLLIWHSTTGRERLREFLQQDPRNFQLRLAMGRYLTTEGRLAEARDLLEQLTREDPKHPAAAAALMECLYEADERSLLQEVAARWSSDLVDEPWMLIRMRGEAALYREDAQEAERLFRRLLSFDPANPWGTMGLARAYELRGRVEDYQQTLMRSLILSEIRVHLANVQVDDPAGVQKLIDLCEQTGLEDAVLAFRTFLPMKTVEVAR